MRSNKLISSILGGKWAIDIDFAFSQGPFIAGLLNQNFTVKREKPDANTAFAISPSAETKPSRYSYWDGFERAPAGSVAVVRLYDTLMKDDQECGPVGTATLGEIIKAAAAHENIAGIVLHVDSPGGTVDGTEVLGNIIKSVEKPVVTFVDGLMASAAFWIGSYGDEIIASTDTDEIGSVGVLCSFADLQPYYEKMGIVFRTIVASTSPDKVKMAEGVRLGKKEAIEEYKKEVLDVIDEKFMNIIRENLPNIKEEHLTGKLYFARDLMGIVVNSIGTLDDAVNRVAELAREKQNSKNKSTSAAEEHIYVTEETIEKQTSGSGEDKSLIISKNMKQYTHVNAVLGVEGLETVEDSVSLNDEQMQALDNALAADNSKELQSQLDAAKNTISQHETTISEKDATISQKDTELAEKTAEIARLKGKAEETPGAKTEGDDADLASKQTKTVVKEDDDFATAVEKVGHEYLAK